MIRMVLEEETNERLRRAKRLLLLIPHKSQLKEDSIKSTRKKGGNMEEAKTIT